MTDTREKVPLIALQLMSEGQTPTANAVRQRIGYGGLATITSELKAFFSQSSALLSPEHQIPDDINSMFKSLWITALDAAGARFASQVEAFQDKNNALESLVSDLRQQIDQQTENHQQTTSALSEQCAHETAQHQLTEQALLSVKEAHAQTLEELAQALQFSEKEQAHRFSLEEQVSSLVNSHAKAMHQLEEKNKQRVAKEIERSQITENRLLLEISSLRDKVESLIINNTLLKESVSQADAKALAALESAQRSKSTLALSQEKVEELSSLLDKESEKSLIAESKLQQSIEMHRHLVRSNERLMQQLSERQSAETDPTNPE